MTELVLKEEVYEIVGAALEVYYKLGRGFLINFVSAIRLEWKRYVI